MSRVVVVAAHPEQSSFTMALAGEAADAAAGAGAVVTVQDLYKDGFDPRMPASEVGTTLFADELTERYARELLAADAVVVVHPVWFFHVPGVLKGWVDRVLRDGVVYDVTGGGTRGRLKAKAGLVINTANSGDGVEVGLGEPLERFWRDVVLGPAGVRSVVRMRLPKVAESSEERRALWLGEVRAATITMVTELPSNAEEGH